MKPGERMLSIFGWALLVLLASWWSTASAMGAVQPASISHDTAAYTYAAASYVYDAPPQLSSSDSAVTDAQGSPVGPGAVSWGRSVAVRGFGVAANTGTGGISSVVKGEFGVQRSIAAAEARGETVVGREITMDTSAGRVRPDILVRDGQGNLKFIESKNGPSASLTPNQSVGYPALRSEGGIPMGGNASRAGLTPGEPIGPIQVQEDWW